LIGDIIHNPEVNRQLEEMGIQKLPWKQLDSSYDRIAADDVVIIPAFGVPTPFMDALEEKGVQIVDTTCGDVMKVWKRVKNYAAMGITSIIHGKATHEETSATASRALGERGKGKVPGGLRSGGRPHPVRLHAGPRRPRGVPETV
jgi:ispH_lytB: 4-hydroxy-3-methylbut-2-enyl diphosphate reductase